MTNHPLPWSVVYCPRFDWHKKSCPTVLDADGNKVCEMPQHVSHPGMYDELADLTAHRIVSSMNASRRGTEVPDAMYVKFMDGKVVVTEESRHRVGVFFDTDAEGRCLGVEILGPCVIERQ